MMPVIQGYELVEQLSSGAQTHTYRAVRLKDNLSVIIKLLKSAYPNPKEIDDFRYEYDLVHNIDIPGIIRIYSMEHYNNSVALIMEDIQGISLTQYVKDSPLDLKEFLNIALQLTKTLQDIHKYNIIHKDLNPNNIIINPDSMIVKITDFSISSRLTREFQSIKSPESLEGTLAYISPEQTGRMNRSIDYRTDFYSLGVTLYKLITGRIPFETLDPVELVHAHIARLPEPPNKVIPSIPTVVSEIIMKLMAKTAEERYQSALGLYEDLNKCLTQFHETSIIDGFTPGEFDISDLFRIPEKLYGRESEIEQFVSAFRDISIGDKKLMLCAGEPGIGKSSVINECLRLITEQRGYYIEGKYDQLKRNIPYSAFVEAFRELTKQLLGESDNRLGLWRSKILEHIGDNGQLILDVIPEMELIIGKQPVVEELPPLEAQNRFNLVFQDFIKVFARETHPLVIFLDDLQWADSASLKLMEVLLSDPELKYALFLGAYRDNEVDKTHPFMSSLDRMTDEGVNWDEIKLTHLNLDHISQLLEDTLHRDREETEELTSLIQLKTRGNPFFITQFLYSLYKDKLFSFDNGWHWDINRIHQADITDNVVELMAIRISHLEEKTWNILKIAACIQVKFSLEFLAHIMGKSNKEVFGDFSEAIREGMVVKIAGEAKFIHDKVEEAVYSLIDEGERSEIHYKIGKTLLNFLNEQEREERIFSITDQLNHAKDRLNSEERNQLILLNIKAGKRAKASSAYIAANNFFQHAAELLSEDAWDTDYGLMLSLYTEWSEAEYMATHYSTAEELFDIVLKHAKSLLDKVKVYQIMIVYYNCLMRFQEAIELAVEVVNQLGVSFPKPENIERVDVLKKLKEFEENLGGRDISELVDLPLLDDPYKKEVIEILVSVIVPFWDTYPEALIYELLIIANISLEYGVCSASSVGFGFLSSMLCGGLEKIEFGFNIGEIALKLQDRFHNRYYSSIVTFLFYNMVHFWKKPLKWELNKLLKSYHDGLESGNIQWASYCINHYCMRRLLAGDPLQTAQKDYETYTIPFSRLKQKDAYGFFNPPKQTVYNLLGYAEDPCKLTGEFFDEDLSLKEFEEVDFQSGIGLVYICKLLILSVLDEYERALPIARKIDIEKLILSNSGQFQPFIGIFLIGITFLQNLREVSEEEQQIFLLKVQEIRERLNNLSQHCPSNFRSMYLLLSAELHRVEKGDLATVKLYDEAIRAAVDSNFPHIEGLANELTAKFYLSLNLNREAKIYLAEARYCYMKWGAKVKIDRLDVTYAGFFKSLGELSAVSPGISVIFTDETIKHPKSSSDSIQTEFLDIKTVLKTSQIISGEIVLEDLLKNLMLYVLENAGARKGMIIMQKDNKLVIEAESTLEDREPRILQSIPIDSYPYLSTRVVKYVKRTHETVVLNDAVNQGQFMQDIYIRQNQSKSILCLPIIHKTKLIGILYLENELVTGVFTPQRLALLNVLSSQAAISIENAQLYSTLEHKVEERTTELRETLEELQSTQTQLVEVEKMASLGGLVAGVAHEINTPVGIGVTASSHMVEETTEILSLLDQNQLKRADLLKFLVNVKESGDLILSTLKRAGKMIQEFRQLAIDQSNEEKRIFNVKDYIEGIVMSLGPGIKDSKLNFDILCSETLNIHSYPGAFWQIINNLVTNSLTHAYDNGDKGTLLFRIKTEDNNLILQYSDDGKGIAKNMIDKIFEPFFTTNRSSGGTGLGLHIVYNIVTQKLFGTIDVESQEGSGTIFTITLPLTSD